MRTEASCAWPAIDSSTFIDVTIAENELLVLVLQYQCSVLTV